MKTLTSSFLFFLWLAKANCAVISFPWYDVDAVDSLNLGLVAYWSMDELSGTRQDLEPTGSAQDLTDNNTVTSVTGKISAAAFFTAANGEYLSHADSADLSVGNIDFTFAGWFLATNLIVNHTIASQWSVSPGAQRSWRLWFHSAIGKMEFEVSSDGTATTARPATTFGLPTTNVWYFIAARHDAAANTISISINNGIVDTTSYSAGVFDSTADFLIGARGAGSDPWDGALDECGFWKRVLTATELTRLYNLGTGKTCCPFVP